MERRIRVKCVACAASIELLVDQQELLDVHCPRCRHLFTAIVPPVVVEAPPLELPSSEHSHIELVEPVEDLPPVRMTRVVQPAASAPSRPTTQPVRRPSRPAPLPQDPLANSTWQAPLPQYQPAPRVTGAMHVKAFLIAGGAVLGVGLLVMVGFLVKSALSSIQWSSADEPTASSSLASEPESQPTTSPSAAVTGAGADATVRSEDSTGGIAGKVIEQAKQIAQAAKASNNEFIIDRTYPKLVSAAGGRSKMLAELNKAMQTMANEGITIADYKVSNQVTVREVRRKVFAVVSTTMDLDYQGRLLRSDSYLLAISEDKGRTFTFLDGSAVSKNPGVVRRLLPDMPQDLALPAVSTPREVSR